MSSGFDEVQGLLQVRFSAILAHASSGQFFCYSSPLPSLCGIPVTEMEQESIHGLNSQGPTAMVTELLGVRLHSRVYV